MSVPTGNELREVINTYISMEFNGAIGSIGCTHILLNKYPKEYDVNICTGKETYSGVSDCYLPWQANYKSCEGNTGWI